MPKKILKDLRSERRLAYVRVANHSGMDVNELLIAISEVARQRKEFPAPSITTVLRWLRWIDANGRLPFQIKSGSQYHAPQFPHKNRIYED